MVRWTRTKSATGLCHKTMTMPKLRPDIWCMSLTRTRYFFSAASTCLRSVSCHFVYSPDSKVSSFDILFYWCFTQHPNVGGINVVYLVSKLMMLIVQFPCRPFSGPDADQRGDPWKLEHVCRKSGHQLRRRPYQEPWWALSFQCSFWRVCLWVRGGLLNIFVLSPLQPPLHPLIIIAGQMSVYWIVNQHWRRGGMRVCPTTNTKGPTQFYINGSVSDIQEQSQTQWTYFPSMVPSSRIAGFAASEICVDSL